MDSLTQYQQIKQIIDSLEMKGKPLSVYKALYKRLRMSPTDELTPRQKSFVKSYIEQRMCIQWSDICLREEG